MFKSSEIKLITTLALPLAAAFLAQKGMQVVDTVMMGWIGPQALAAAALSIPLFMMVLLFGMGTLSAVGVFIAHAKGANRYDEVKINLQHGCCLALLLSIPSMLLIWFAPHLLAAIDQVPQVVTSATLFLHSLVWGLPGMLLFLVWRDFTAAFALTRIIFLITLGSIPCTFIFNYLLIYGKYGLPALGIAGIGYAGAIIMWMMFFCIWCYSKKHPQLKQHNVFLKAAEFDWKKISALLRVGVSSGTILVMDASMFTLAAMMMGHFGVSALAAHQITMQCVMLAFAVPFSLSMATALQVGHCAGAGDFKQAQRYAYLGLTMGLSISIITAAVFVIFPQSIAKLFLTSAISNVTAIEKSTATFLAIGALFQCCDALQIIMSGALKGLKDTFIPMLLSVGCYWLFGVGTAYYLAFHTRLGAAGIWYGLTFGICSIGIILFCRFLLLQKSLSRFSH